MRERINNQNYEAFLLDYAEGRLDTISVKELMAFSIAHPELGIELDSLELPYLDAETIVLPGKKDILKQDLPLADEELIAYMEGLLYGKEKQLLEERLLREKDLQSTLELYRKTILQQDETNYPDKSALHKTSEDYVLNNPVLNYLEAQLSPDEKVNFERDLHANNSLSAELALFGRTKLVPDATLVYPDKAALKKKSRVIVLFSYRSVAAVAAALLLLLGLVVIFKFTTNPTPELPGLADAGTNPAAPHVAASQSKAPVKEPVVASETTQRENSPLRPLNKVRPAFTPTAGIKEHKPAGSASNLLAKEDSLITPDAEQFPAVVSQSLAAATNNVQKNDNPEKNKSESDQKPPVFTTENFTPVNELAQVNDDDDEQVTEEKKPGFWQRLAKAARHANALGIKNIDGEEHENNSILISFNSFSVEKK